MTQEEAIRILQTTPPIGWELGDDLPTPEGKNCYSKFIFKHKWDMKQWNEALMVVLNIPNPFIPQSTQTPNTR